MSVYTHPNKPGWQMIKLFRGKDKPEYIPYCGTKEQAQSYENELRGIHDTTDPHWSDKMPDFKQAYKNEVMPGTYIDFEWALKQLEPFFKNMKIRHITPQTIEQYKTMRLSMPTKTGTVSRRTINRELTYLSKFLQYCGSELKPVKFRKKDTQPATPDVLTMDELDLIISHLKPPIKHLVMLMAYNGLRKTEAFTIRCIQAEKDGTVIRVLGKGGKWRTVPVELPELQTAIIAAKQKQPDGYLFPNPATNEPYNDIRKSLKNAATAAGIIKPVYNHLCRHSFATAIAGAGVNTLILQGLLGHADLKTVQIYTHLADTTLRIGAAALIKTPAKTAKPQTRIKRTSKSNPSKLGV